MLQLRSCWCGSYLCGRVTVSLPTHRLIILFVGLFHWNTESAFSFVVSFEYECAWDGERPPPHGLTRNAGRVQGPARRDRRRKLHRSTRRGCRRQCRPRVVFVGTRLKSQCKVEDWRNPFAPGGSTREDGGSIPKQPCSRQSRQSTPYSCLNFCLHARAPAVASIAFGPVPIAMRAASVLEDWIPLARGRSNPVCDMPSGVPPPPPPCESNTLVGATVGAVSAIFVTMELGGSFLWWPLNIKFYYPATHFYRFLSFGGREIGESPDGWCILRSLLVFSCGCTRTTSLPEQQFVSVKL